jgi:type VI secretion system protein ImpB
MAQSLLWDGDAADMNRESTLSTERLNIVCKSADDAEIELPLRMLFVGDYMGRDDRPSENRVPIRIDKDNFARVLAAHGPTLDLVVTPTHAPPDTSAVRASLTFHSLSDFGPDSIAQQIPDVSRLLAVRDALTALKNTGDLASFHQRLEEVLDDAHACSSLLSALGLGDP